MTNTIRVLLSLLLLFQQGCGLQDQQNAEEFGEAVRHFENEEYEKALLYTDQLLEKDPDDYASWTLKGRALFNLGKQEDGLNAIDNAIEINPDYYWAYSYRASMRYQSGNFTMGQVIHDANIALSYDPENIELIRVKAHYLYKSGRFKEAWSEYNRILEYEPNDYSATVFCATTNRKLGNQQLALKGYNKAIQIDSSETLAYDERAFLFIEQEKYDLAIKDYDLILLAIQESKEYGQFLAFTHNNRGFAYHKSGNNEKALSDINYSLDLLPTNSYAYKNRALVYLDIGDGDKGCADLKKAIELGFTQLYGPEAEELIGQYCN